jgi:hypothetical protein
MFDRVLSRLQDRILAQEYVLTTHADEEMNDDDLTVHDIESCILTGHILERQKDQMTGEWKYRVRGKALDDTECEVVTKLGPTDKAVIITVYRV